MLIELDLQSDVPIYTQLMNVIIEGIASKQLKPGEPLPSVRSMAADLGINLHTVNKAYTLLKQEGLIQVHRQKGVMVNPDGMPEVDEEYMHHLQQELRPLIAKSVCRGMSEEQFFAICKEYYAYLKNEEK